MAQNQGLLMDVVTASGDSGCWWLLLMLTWWLWLWWLLTHSYESPLGACSYMWQKGNAKQSGNSQTNT